MTSHAKQVLRPPFGGSLYTTPVTSLALDIVAAISRHAERRVARRQLHALSDRELADIGVSRSQIDTAVTRWDGRR